MGDRDDGHQEHGIMWRWVSKHPPSSQNCLLPLGCRGKAFLQGSCKGLHTRPVTAEGDLHQQTHVNPSRKGETPMSNLPNHIGIASTLGLPWEQHGCQGCRKVWEWQGGHSCGGKPGAVASPVGTYDVRNPYGTSKGQDLLWLLF